MKIPYMVEHIIANMKVYLFPLRKSLRKSAESRKYIGAWIKDMSMPGGPGILGTEDR